MIPEFKVDNCGLLIGMCSVPYGVTEEEFFNNTITSELSHKYKEGRAGSIKRNQINNPQIYNPIGYKTFGDNNLMFFSIFDDFSYPNRVFHPFNGNGKDNARYQNYDYQLVVGLNTMRVGENNNLLGTFAPKIISAYPFTCVTRLKTNPIFLCGNGLYYTELIKTGIQSILHDSPSSTIILNGVGSDELIAVSFANSMRDITEIVFRIRNLQFKELESFDKEWYDQVYRDSFAATCKDIKIEDAHIFSSSYSVSGYAINRKGIPELLPDDNCHITFTWTIKPGHIANFTGDLSRCMNRLGLNKDEIWKDKLYVTNTKVCLPLDHKVLGEDSKSFFIILDELRGLDIHKRNIRKLQIDVSVEDDHNILSDYVKHKTIPDEELDNHPNTRLTFKEYVYDRAFLVSLRSYLDKTRLSKVIKERIMKMYHNYNDCIQDPAFAVSFIGLRPFLDFLDVTIKRYYTGESDYNSREIHEWLDSILRDFEQAYLNRFHQSNRMRTLSDFNMEWNGGIQQIISAMDYTYKMLMKCCGVDKPKNFMYISGYERIHVSDHSYRINMQHVTYPELFVTTVWKEMFNFLPPEITKNADKDNMPLKRFFDNDFMYRLKIQIYNHYQFNPANKVHSAFFHSLDREVLVSFMADSLAFYYGYNNDFELFQYWYWRYLMQTPMLYNPANAIDKNTFFLFMVRILLVRMISSENHEDAKDMRFQPFDPTFSSEWICYFEDALTLSKIIYELLEKFNYSQLIKNTFFKIIFNTYPEIRVKAEQKYDDISEILENATAEIYRNRNNIYKSCIDMFNERIIPTQLFADSTADFIYGFLSGYLVYIRDMDRDLDHDMREHFEKLLPRNEKGYPDIPQEDADIFGNLLADPCGGFFCIDGIAIHQYFAVRSIFYMTLFHIYHKNILKLITLK